MKKTAKKTKRARAGNREPKKPVARSRPTSTQAEKVTLADVERWMTERGRPETSVGFARFGIVPHRPFGVTVGELRDHGKRIGRDHDLARQLWNSGRFESQMLTAFIADPTRLTLREMNAWVAECDGWAIVDALCFHLFDRSPHAWSRIAIWGKAPGEFQRRAGFALLWALSLHDRDAPDERFVDSLPLLEQAATDSRAYVKKAVDMALRALGGRNPYLNGAAIETAERLATSADPTARWIGKHSLRTLRSKPPRRTRLG